MKAIIESQSAAPDSMQPSFREDNLIPDGYLANVLIFFILLIGIGTMVAKLLKGRISGIPHTVLGRRNQHSLVKHTERLSSNTRLYFIEYQGASLVVAESKAGVDIHVISQSRNTTELKCQDEKVELPINVF